MDRKLALVAVAVAVGIDYDQAVSVVNELSPTLPHDDIEAGRAVASAASELLYPDLD